MGPERTTPYEVEIGFLSGSSSSGEVSVGINYIAGSASECFSQNIRHKSNTAILSLIIVF